MLAALLGLGVVLRGWRNAKRWRDTWTGVVLAIYMLAYTIVALPGKRLQANLLLVLIAPIALPAAYGVVWLWRRLGKGRWVMAGLTALLLVWPAYLSALLTQRITALDNRMLAQAWVYEHVPKETSVYLLNPYNAPIDPLDYDVSQTYGGQATPESVLQSDAQIIVYSDTFAFVTLRDPAASDPNSVANERAIIEALQTDWVELKRFVRRYWPGQAWPPDDVSYWHQMEIVIYCNPADCPVTTGAIAP